MDVDELLAEETVHPRFDPGQGWLPGMDKESDSWLDQVLLSRGEEDDEAPSGGPVIPGATGGASAEGTRPGTGPI